MGLIKVGLEANGACLRNELLMRPGRYFAILIIDDRAAVCIRTCDGRGENLQSHVVDGLMTDSDGNLVSIFEKELYESLNRQKISNRSSNRQEFCQISQDIADKIRALPGFVDYIMTSILTKDRNIIVSPLSWPP